VLGDGDAEVARDVAAVVLVLEVDEELSDLACLVRFFQAATEVQVRQLEISLVCVVSWQLVNVEERTACRPCRGQRPWATGLWSRCQTHCARSWRRPG
jgi:hypothetical protein